MMRSRFDQSPPISLEFPEVDELGRPVLDHSPQPSAFLQSLQLIARIAAGRRFQGPEIEISDLSQSVSLRLWKWIRKYGHRAELMGKKEWEAFTAKATHNEISRCLKLSSRGREVPLEEVDAMRSVVVDDHFGEIAFHEQVRKVWQAVCSYSLRQRRALLLHSPKLLRHFVGAGIDDESIASLLDLSSTEFRWMSNRLPISDAEIAGLKMSETNGRSGKWNAKAVKDARYDARRKLEKMCFRLLRK